ncbi:MAG: T9SS type A sorting domain-containing protein [Taibaiella sp.]|nr:T9SS type A sorting domain-containing protein [Taibaiella sp.]
MKNKIILLFIALSLGGIYDSSMAQVSLPYYTGFDNDDERSGWQQFKTGASGTEWFFTDIAPYSGSHCLYHNYPVGGTEITDNWFVSPAFEIPDGGWIDTFYHSFSGFGIPASDDTVAVYLLVGSPDPALASERLLLLDFRGAQYKNDNLWYYSAGTELPAREETCYLGFRYRTVVNWLDVKIDHVKVSSHSPSSIDPGIIQDFAVQLYPNPVTNKVLNIDSKHAFERISIYNMAGQEVYASGYKNRIQLPNLVSGTYLIRLISKGGNYDIHKFVLD